MTVSSLLSTLQIEIWEFLSYFKSNEIGGCARTNWLLQMVPSESNYVDRFIRYQPLSLDVSIPDIVYQYLTCSRDLLGIPLVLQKRERLSR